MGDLFSKREFLGFIQKALRLHFILSHAIVRAVDGEWARDDFHVSHWARFSKLKFYSDALTKSKQNRH